jgi:ATP-dependent RNA helicase DHX29
MTCIGRVPSNDSLFFGVRVCVLSIGGNSRQLSISTVIDVPAYKINNPTNTKFEMAGGKKKKKPVSNPARGFATTSIASKPKSEATDVELESTSELPSTLQNEQEDSTQIVGPGGTISDAPPNSITPEEFEKQLESSELQVLVEKYAQKSKRDALRQKTRLETDRRVLRGQAENLNTRKWLPPELMEEILDLVKAEERFVGPVADSAIALKLSSEEELTIRLWTLQQSLTSAGFLESKVILALEHVLKLSDKIATGNKDAIWGLEEALDWLARNCSRDELPDYENWHRRPVFPPKSQSGERI